MATGSQCGKTRTEPFSHFPRAAMGQGTAPGLASARRTALPLRHSAPGYPGSSWEQAYFRRDEQVRYVGAALRPLLDDCPIAGDADLVMSGVFFPGVRSASPKIHPGSFSYRPAPGRNAGGQQ
jgi:hypothetical protein